MFVFDFEKKLAYRRQQKQETTNKQNAAKSVFAPTAVSGIKAPQVGVCGASRRLLNFISS
jgi:hypothetical protein